jgi:cystathionine gamma-synthase
MTAHESQQPQPQQCVETVAVHAGAHIDRATGAVTPPIHLSTTFERAADGSYTDGYVYGRSDNPNRRALEECLVALEGGSAAIAFPSGQAAAHAVLAALRPGDHLLLPDDCYFGTRRVADEVLAPWGLAWSMVDMTDLEAVAAALRPTTRLVWIETPSNPRLKITDIEAVTTLAHKAGARVVCDNTWATSLATQPLALGADLVVYATTKYLGGHSDLTGGAVIAAQQDANCDRIRLAQTIGGSVPAPFDCWLLLRSIRTLPWRVRAHTANAQAVAEALVGHPAIARVNYPGLATHPGHEIARKQMALFGGMLSIELHGGVDAALAASQKVRLFTRATSLGGVESLIEHRYSVEGAFSVAPPALLRISVGLEHPDDLVADLRAALA